MSEGAKHTQGPTEDQRKLAAWGDHIEKTGQQFQTSLYWRLLPQIEDARAAIRQAEGRV